MLSQEGHKVTLIVRKDYEGTGLVGVDLKPVLPVFERVSYAHKRDLIPEHKEAVLELSSRLASWLAQFDMVFTHDIIQLKYHLPYALALRNVSKKAPHLKFFHWLHSKPGAYLDWWDYSQLPQHTIVYPSSADLSYLRATFETHNVICIPHAQDLRDVRRFRRESKDLIDMFPQLLDADLVQIYPACTDRFQAKGVRELIVSFSVLKKSGHSVCLVIVNQSAHARERRLVDPIAYLEKVALRCGLEVGKEVCFTSEILNHKYSDGVPHDVLMDLFACSNLFIFPSHTESFGMVLYEAILAGSVLPILNSSVPAVADVFGDSALYADFGETTDGPSSALGEQERLGGMAKDISNQVLTNPILRARLLAKREFNSKTIFQTHYRPLFNGDLKSISKGEIR
jgi:glycosyltransferase involved in cell wall biosynthesis